MTILLQLTLILYTLGLVHSVLGFFQKRRIIVQVALWLVVAGFISHSAFLVSVGVSRMNLPVTSLSDVLGYFAWCVTLIFLVAYLRYRINVLGAFVLPLVSLLTVFSELIWEENHAIPPMLKSRWLFFHSGVALLAYASFFLTFVSGVMYLIQERELKSKNFRFLYFRLPSLQVCDSLFRQSLFFGFAMMSITITTGALWAQQAWGQYWSWDPKETSALVTWLIYLILVTYRLSSSWRGRRAAYISIAGFISVLITFGVNFFKGLHTYL
jgi:cytochrome c-type biogenesis protein CcsB